MKTRTERHYYANDYRHSRPYPNAAERSYFQEKLLDQVTSVGHRAGNHRPAVLPGYPVITF